MSRLNYINLYTTNPAFNLAAEQYVFDSLPKDRNYFMLWQNDNAVIIGKYQNTLAEVNEQFINDNNIEVVRRLSGGGAVYHDLGNLNFTFIADAGDMEELNMKVFCEPVIDVLRSMGINAEINGRNDMTIDGKKFSGNSQYMRGHRVMHHGTIMFSSNLDAVSAALNVDTMKIEGKGIKSVRSRVTNVSDYLEDDISVDQFRETLLQGILAKTPGEEYVLSDKDYEGIVKLEHERYSTWDWNWGKSPECTIVKSGRIDGCGKIEAYITAEHAEVTAIEFKGDFFSTEDPDALCEKFIGKHADKEGFTEALSDVDVSRYFTGAKKEDVLNILCDRDKDN